MQTYRLLEYKTPIERDVLETIGVPQCVLDNDEPNGDVVSLDQLEERYVAGNNAVINYVGFTISYLLEKKLKTINEVTDEDERSTLSDKLSHYLYPALGHPLSTMGALHAASCLLGDNHIIRWTLDHDDHLDLDITDAFMSVTPYILATDQVEALDSLGAFNDADEAIAVSGQLIADFTAATWCDNHAAQWALMHMAVHAYTQPLMAMGVLFPLLTSVVASSMECKPWKRVGPASGNEVIRIPVPDDFQLGASGVMSMPIASIPDAPTHGDIRNN